MDRKSWPIRLMAVMLVVPAFACADNDEAEVDINADNDAAPPPAMAPVTVQLEPMGSSSITGEAVATHGPDDVNVRVTLNGLTEGEDYEATLRYGMCSDAQTHLSDDDMADAGTNRSGTTGTRSNTGSTTTTDAQTPGTEPAAGGMAEHEPGDEFGTIDLNVTGMTATGSADIDSDDLRESEPAYIAILGNGANDEETVLACADLSGHGGMNMGTGSTGTSTTPGASSTTPGTTPSTGSSGSQGR